MNALLQHRGHNLMGAGRSIAVQNFNEQACILGLGAFYTGMTRFGLSAFTVDRALRRARRRHDVADPALARDATACTTATRSSTCSRSRAATSIDAPTATRRAAAARRRSRCSSTPSSGASRGGRSASCRRAGLHPLWATALIYTLAVAGDRRACGRARCAQVLRDAGAVAARRSPPALTNAAFNWAVVHRRRRARRAAVLPDAAVDAAARARRCSASG